MNKQTNECDVLVVGGGTAGTVAVIQAARAGARTILLEVSTQMGGTISNGLVTYLTYFRVGSRQIVGGIGWELVQEAMELSNSEMPDWEVKPPTRPSYGVVVKPAVFAMLAEEKALAAGAQLLYSEFPMAIEREKGRWRVECVGHSVARTIYAREIIDCTGDASAVRLAGGECERESECQPGTLRFKLGGYELDEIDADRLDRAFRAAVASGELQASDYCYCDRRGLIEYLRCGGANVQHIVGADSSTAETQAHTDITARRRLLAMLRFLRRQPGLEHCTVEHCAATTGVRETWRIAGDVMITAEDYLSGRQFDDAVGLTYFFVDRHCETGIVQEFIRPGAWPEIPLGALTVRGIDGLTAAGRCISSDRDAQSGLRVMPSCMAMGQAAGAAAALGVRLGVPSKRVPLDRLRVLLREHGAVLPDRFA